MPRTPSHPVRPRAADIVQIVGDLDETVVNAIMATGASAVEIEEAVRWATGDAEQLDKAKREMSAAVEAVYDILVADPSYVAEGDRR